MAGPVTRAFAEREHDEPEPARDPLDVAGALRVPIFERGTMPQTKISALEEYVLVTAHWHGELHAERRALLAEGADLQDEWDTMQGWEINRRGKTDRSADLAKAETNPALWKRLQTIRRRVRALTDELARLDGDFEKVSRAYTMISGG